MRSISFALVALLTVGCNPVPEVDASPKAPDGGADDSVHKALNKKKAGQDGVVLEVEPYQSVVKGDETPDETVIASWEGGQMTMGDLRTQAAVQLSQLDAQFIADQREAETTFLTTRHQLQLDTLDGYVMEALLQKEAEKLGYADTDALVAEKIIPLVAEPTEEQIQEFYLAYQRQLQGASLEDVREPIAEQLRQQNAQMVISNYIAGLQAAYGLKTNLPFPELPRVPISTDDDPFLGVAGAPVEIVIFAEYQCPYCATVTPTMEQLIEKYPGKLQVVFRDFPLSFHDRAIPAAIAANCAGEQDKYWEMHNLLMANQRSLTDENFQTWARELSLNQKKFSACLADPAQADEVDADFKDGVAAGVNGTPSIYVNGMKASPSPDALTELIERELSDG